MRPTSIATTSVSPWARSLPSPLPSPLRSRVPSHEQTDAQVRADAAEGDDRLASGLAQGLLGAGRLPGSQGAAARDRPFGEERRTCVARLRPVWPLYG